MEEIKEKELAIEPVNENEEKVEGFSIDGKKVNSMEEFVTSDLDEESKKIYDEFIKSGLNANEVMANQMERIFASAYKTFCEANMERIKFFIESGKRPDNISKEYDIELNNTIYHWKEDLFFKSEEFKSTKLGTVPLYILDYARIHEEVFKMDDSLFDDLKESYEKEKGTKVSYRVLKENFNANLEDIAEKISSTVSNQYLEKKINYADIDAVDKIFSKEMLEKSKTSSKSSARDLSTSLRSNKEKLIKKIKKDLSKSKNRITKNDEQVITVMGEQIGELFGFAVLRNVYDNISLEILVSRITQLEPKNKDVQKLFIYTKLLVYKMLCNSLVTAKDRIILPSLVTQFYNETDIEKSYIFSKLIDLGKELKDNPIFALKEKGIDL